MSAGRLAQLAAALDGRLSGADAAYRGVSTDTRSLRAGELFVALSGPNFDGHAFLEAAAAAGAAGALVEREVQTGLPQICVADTRAALGRLGALWRAQHSPTVVAVTGSNGKTTVKEMIASVLRRRGPVLATEGNFNNDIGVPLTLLRMRPEHRAAVIEIGANAPGEIAQLAGLAAPAVAAVTNASPAHLQGFGSLDGIAREKGALFAALGAGGCAVINAEDAYAPLWAEMAGTARKLTFGTGPDADFRYTEVRPASEGPGAGVQFSLETPDGAIALSLPLVGAHNAANGACAAAAAWASGATAEDIAAGLAQVRGVAGRLLVKAGHAGAQLIDDTYNANPASAVAAIDFLTSLPGRPWLVLGDMGELGPESAQLHAGLGRTARARGVERLFALGRFSQAAAQAFGPGATEFATLDALLAALRPDLAPGINVLIKGSRSARLERVVTALAADGQVCEAES